MGLLVDGSWIDRLPDDAASEPNFNREGGPAPMGERPTQGDRPRGDRPHGGGRGGRPGGGGRGRGGRGGGRNGRGGSGGGGGRH